MESHMVRSKDPPLLQVLVSYEATRLSPQHLIDAYDRLMPTVRRARARSNRGGVPIFPLKIAKAGGEQ
jgi:hypothetical protein